MTEFQSVNVTSLWNLNKFSSKQCILRDHVSWLLGTQNCLFHFIGHICDFIWSAEPPGWLVSVLFLSYTFYTWLLSVCPFNTFLWCSQEGISRIGGVHTSYVYVGMAMTTFAFHVEDGDVFAISYNHSGAPKIWYFVSGEAAEKLEQFLIKIKKQPCKRYFRHKTLTVPPWVLIQLGIDVARVKFFFSSFFRIACRMGELNYPNEMYV